MSSAGTDRSLIADRNRKISFSALVSVFAPAEVKLKTLTARLLVGGSRANLRSKTFSPPVSMGRGSPHREMGFVLDHLSWHPQGSNCRGCALPVRGEEEKRNVLGGRIWHSTTATGVTYQVPQRFGGNLTMPLSFHRGKNRLKCPVLLPSSCLLLWAAAYITSTASCNYMQIFCSFPTYMHHFLKAINTTHCIRVYINKYK